jgi:hypothetical protein
MNNRMDHIGTHMNTQLADGPNAKPVAQDSKRNDRRDEQSTIAEFPQEEVPGQKAGDEENQRGMDPAAFRGHL